MTRVPAERFPLYEYLEEELATRGWSKLELAVRMGGATSDEQWTDYLILDFWDELRARKDMLMDQTTADKLGRAFGVSPQFFVNLVEAWRTTDEPRNTTPNVAPNGAPPGKGT